MSSHPGRPAAPLPEPSVIPENGWHVGHYFYRFRRDLMDGPLSADLQSQFRAALHPEGDAVPQRLASYWTSGHRADFGVLVMDPHPAKVDAIHQAIMAPGIGRFVEPAWSFVSLSEVSEYVPTIEGIQTPLGRRGCGPGFARGRRESRCV